jgi:hypothetical protein
MPRGKKTTFDRRIDYTPADIMEMSDREVRKVYSELRKTVYMRQKRLKEQFPLSSFIGTGKYWKFPKTKDLSTEEVRGELAEASRFLQSDLSTIKGQRERAEEIHELFQSKYEIDIPPEDVPRFMDFLDDLEARYGAKVLGSEQMAKVFKEMERKNISRANVLTNYEYYLKHQKEIAENKKLNARSRPFTARQLVTEFGIGTLTELEDIKEENKLRKYYRKFREQKEREKAKRRK